MVCVGINSMLNTHVCVAYTPIFMPVFLPWLLVACFLCISCYAVPCPHPPWQHYPRDLSPTQPPTTQLSQDDVMEATRYASKHRDVFCRPDVEVFAADRGAMLALLLQAFEVVHASTSMMGDWHEDGKVLWVVLC